MSDRNDRPEQLASGTSSEEARRQRAEELAWEETDGERVCRLVMSDITGSNRAEEALQETIKLQSVILDNIAVGIARFTARRTSR